MSDQVISLLALDGQHTRSISLERDLHDDRVIDSYLLTPNSIGAIRQIASDMASGNAQRAWKIVGPYGSGKSALGVMLAQLMAGPELHGPAAARLREVSASTADLFKAGRRYSLAVVGSRVSFGVALAVAISDALVVLGKKKALAAVQKQLDIAGGTYRSLPFNSIAGELASDFAAALQADGYQGLTLLIDEVGKFIEYAALHPSEGDLIAIQQVAEAACKYDDDKLAVIAMLHQHFASYAAGVGRALGDEWHKISARFAEIPFDEPVERYAYFARHALGVTGQLQQQAELTTEAKEVYARAVEYGVLRSASEQDATLFEEAECLYPLHPLTLAAMATVSKRFGQSERTFHSFLKGAESGGLRDFAQSHPIGNWYRITDLYDFLAGGYGLRFRDLGAERRWVFAQEAIQRITQNEVALNVLKAIAVLELVQGGLGTPINVETIDYALGAANAPEIAATLAHLVEQGVLVKRKRNTEFALAVSDAVNIEALYEEAARRNENDLIQTGINAALSKRPVVANRHYDETGTIRTMGVLVGTSEIWPQLPDPKVDEARPDGWLKIVLVIEGSDSSVRALQRLAEENEALCVSGCLVLSAEGRSALADYAIWQEIMREVSAKRLDPWSTRYVEGRLQEAANLVERAVTSALMPSAERPGPTYWYRGAAIEGSERMNASQLASWLFERTFSKAPRIVNELINKDKPASPIVLARQRLFDVILAGDVTRPICGQDEYPPERLIHTSLLRETGIWHEREGQWSLHEPTELAANDIRFVWQAISEGLAGDEPQSFASLMAILGAPPLGVRAGPAGIWIVLYLLVNRSRCAVFERGTLLLELTSEHLQRMFKSPQNFTLRELSNVGDNTRLLADYRNALAAIGCALEHDASYLDVARSLIRWFIRLPDFSKQTQRVGKDAALIRSMLSKTTDPIALLTQTLRKAHVESKSKESFLTWLTSALTDLGMAYRKLQEDVAAELSRGFRINGPLSRVRNQLQAECSKEGATLADTKLKSFILRCTDLILSDEKWLDSVGSLIVQRPLDTWSDDTLSRFQEGLSELCGRYQRWMQVVMRRGVAPRAADRFVGLTLTMAGGEEQAVFVATTDSSKALAQNVLALVKESAQGDAQMAAAALAQAIMDLQLAADSREEEEAKHG
ncbi:hypothetical protein HNQ50_003040 [Silvimonas terrae]|uniref:ATP-binding protein n=1 Tax=Silvimonas terrae TaxID=300266 RepID=A0A840RFH1_9NEIS|nr:hypothetical protein [Silvimonas terrae]MBB5192299.1 hypothetical protein [Silvimonas terrae]